MTTQQVESEEQEHRNCKWGTLHTTRLVVGRLALCKEEGEGEGCSPALHPMKPRHVNPLPLVRWRGATDGDQRRLAR